MARRLPAEWAPQSATLLVWPSAAGPCAGDLDAVRDVIATMAGQLTAHANNVVLVVADAESRSSASHHPRLAGNAHHLRLFDCPADDVWARDFGPLTVFEAGNRRFVDFRFDGWNKRYPAERDDRVTQHLFDAGVLGPGTLERDPHVLEGGSIETNGDGALLTTRRCLLDNNRNPGFTGADFESLFRQRLGIDTVHWLTAGDLIGDDTDGHIDTLARFVRPDTIVYQSCGNPDDEHHRPLIAMAAELEALRDRRGRPYHCLRLPLPSPVLDPGNGRRLPAGYANFVIANGCVLMPAFDDPADEEAAATLRSALPDRRIVPIDCRALIRHNGSLHCVAMHLPAHA